MGAIFRGNFLHFLLHLHCPNFPLPSTMMWSSLDVVGSLMWTSVASSSFFFSRASTFLSSLELGLYFVGPGCQRGRGWQTRFLP
jgi:hypothetical protein